MPYRLYLLVLPLAALLFAPFVPTKAAFVDVDTDSQYGPAILHLQTEGIVQGFADGTYRPVAGITRAEYTKILLLAKYEPQLIAACQTASFADVAADAWYYPYICYAQQNGIVSGFGDGSFRPNDPISYAEGAKILVNTLISQTADAPPPQWWSPYTVLLESYGVKPPTVGLATAPLTRGEMAFMASGIIRTTVAGFIQNRFDGKIVYVNNPGTAVAELEAHCAVEGGKFDQCGSPCAPDAAVCAAVCAYTCALTADDEVAVLILERFGSKIVYQTNDSDDETALRRHCATEGGLYKSCGNSCAPDAEACAEVCVHTCEQIPETGDGDATDDAVTIEEDFVSKLVYTTQTDQNDKKYRAHCAARGGTFEPCGNICAPDAEACADVCAFTCSDIPADSGEADPTTSYYDLGLGISISYPRAAQVSEGSEGENDYVEFSLRGSGQAGSGPITDGVIMRLSRLSHDTQSLTAFVDAEIAAERGRNAITLAKERYEVNGYQGYRFGSDAGVFTYLPADEGEVIAIATLVKDPSGKGYQSTVEAMLASLQIIDTATDSLGDGLVSLRYPASTLTATTAARRLRLTHEVPYAHADICDGQGMAKQLASLTDFDVEWLLLDQSLREAVEANETAGFADEYLTADGGALIANPGLIEPSVFANLRGSVVRLGAEGCGANHHYFVLDDDTTLLVRQRLVGEFAATNQDRDQALAQPGVIAPAQAAVIFEAIMNSVSLTGEAS